MKFWQFYAPWLPDMTFLAQNLNSVIDFRLIDIINQSLSPLGIKGAVLVLEPTNVDWVSL